MKWITLGKEFNFSYLLLHNGFYVGVVDGAQTDTAQYWNVTAFQPLPKFGDTFWIRIPPFMVEMGVLTTS